MKLLKDKKTFPFRSFRGKEPTIEELRVEMEELYKYLTNQIDELLEDREEECSKYTGLLFANNELVIANGDAVYIPCLKIN